MKETKNARKRRLKAEEKAAEQQKSAKPTPVKTDKKVELKKTEMITSPNDRPVKQKKIVLPTQSKAISAEVKKQLESSDSDNESIKSVSSSKSEASSKHDLFIKAISDSINNYNLPAS